MGSPSNHYREPFLAPAHVRGGSGCLTSGFSNFPSADARFLTVSLCLPSLTSRSRRYANMDRASQALAQGVPPGVPSSYRALADHSDVPRSTLHHRARGRRSLEEKARGQLYLRPHEEDVVVKYLLQMSNLDLPIRMKFIPSVAFCATRQRPAADRPLKPPGPNWTKALENRHPELKARRLKALDWNRHEKNTYEKITHWFEVIGPVLQDPVIEPKMCIIWTRPV
jgi:hypothetical protein